MSSLCKRENTLFGTAALPTWQRITILAGPLLKANCPTLDPPPLYCPLPHCPLSCQRNIYLHTDDINTPDSSSVRHSYE
jgi:hypothetical protein